MPRRPRICPAGTCFHVINRAVARLTLFEKQEAYEAFERVLALAHERVNLGIFAYCVMPNHWHFVVCPKTDTQVTDFFRLVELGDTHKPEAIAQSNICFRSFLPSLTLWLSPNVLGTARP